MNVYPFKSYEISLEICICCWFRCLIMFLVFNTTSLVGLETIKFLSDDLKIAE